MLYKDGRIKGVQDTLDGAVAAGLITNPWRVTSLPTPTLLTPGAAINLTSMGSLSLGSSTAWVTAVDITGSGYCDFAAVQAASVTACTLGLKITVDGVEVCNTTSASSSTANRALVAIGEWASGSEFMSGGHPIYFRGSLKIEAQQSASSSASARYRCTLAEPYAA